MSEHIDKHKARRAFSRAAKTYDEAAVLQREVGRRQLERLDLVRLAPRNILDLGCGTGEQAQALLRRYPGARVHALDFALPMLGQARRRGRWRRRPRCICGDMEHLPLADDSIDLLISNLAFQWAADPVQLYRECLRVLSPGGLLMFTTFGPDTLKELRMAWAEVDQTPHVSPFMDMHDLGDILVDAGYAAPVMDVERMVLTYASVDDLMRDLKQIGASNAASGRMRGLTGRGRMQAMRKAYESWRSEGLLPASYEVVYGHAWAPEDKTAPRQVSIPLRQLEG
ncbi:malonyl-ACP O-methyltransferase BioC [Thiolapillus brandeum]|uniref:Malonyl-[acyl-carrier protein] O-methyltransferase n=1 Tax=Thiolapillus brandeum TaxID=1076588 RepID=A0A7U6JIM3_9GAMM|nr:malonyl-ACP O-methyltransferase BioC [Thiolapillus brandeum]BAO44963.1 biotin biosynthesis protein BioC [Thiolapillus brandeum]